MKISAIAKHSRRSLLFLLLLVLGTAVLAAPALAKTKITFLDDLSDSEAVEWLQLAKSRFEALHPDVEIEILAMKRDQLLEKIVIMQATDMLPDVVETSPEVGYEFMQKGFFQDLNPYMMKEANLSWDEYFTPALTAITVESGEHKGKRWLLPGTIWLTGAAFNLSLFAEAGLNAPVSHTSQWANQWTWDDFVEMGKKLVRVDATGKVTRWAAFVPRTWMRWPTWVHNAGGFMFDSYFEPKQSLLNSEPVRVAINYLYEIYQVYRFAYWSGNFVQGKLPISFNQGPNCTQLLANAGATFDFAYGPNPKLVRGGSEVQVVGWVMSATSRHPDIAWEWMKFLSTTMATEYVIQTGRPPAWQTVARRYSELVKTKSPWEHVWIDLISHPDSYQRAIYNQDIRNTMQQAVEAIFDGNQPVGPTLEQLHEVISNYLKENR
ncbi:MAG TPA: extracellular solute-binding protein [Firmicutes bacterium]|nr:extracellular solute-binding protein [Bacillota bacterium]